MKRSADSFLKDTREDSAEVVKNGMSDWQSNLAEMVRKDPRRIGFPKTQPTCSELHHGWLMEANKQVLTKLIKPDFKCIIELGSWLGRSANFIANLAPDAVVFAVDLWDNSIFENDSHYSKEAMFMAILANGPIHDQFLRNTWEGRLNLSGESGPRGIVPMRMDSCQALHLLHSIGVTPDLIYVDANHHYLPVLKDVKACVELFPNAQIVGDDWHYKEVQRAVYEVAELHDKEVYVHIGHCWTYSKALCELEFSRRGANNSSALSTRDPPEKKTPEAAAQGVALSTVKKSFGDLLKMYK